MPNGAVLWAEHAFTHEGWQSNVSVEIDEMGRIENVRAEQPASGTRFGLLLPAIANLHSHAFQRAMAGMTEKGGPESRDTFWSWRELMYKFLLYLTPDDVESIAAFGQMEMLEAGYASVGEFHYLHHQVDGTRYTQSAEMCERIIAAATDSGIGLTLLPVLYEQGGCDGRKLIGGQRRFGNTLDEFSTLFSDAQSCIEKYSNGVSIGIAPHSLRAVTQTGLKGAITLADGRPFHIHIAEQDAEVQEIQSMWNARPVQWLIDHHPVDQTWCLVHATHMLPSETSELARSGATVGLCPITESNLGDGIFNGRNYQQNQGSWGIGTDSNVRISLSEELRTLEYSQRLREKARAVFGGPDLSTGRAVYEHALYGGAQALQRQSGTIACGQLADLVALDSSAASFVAVENDGWFDAWIFASDDRLVTDVWSAGRHIVSSGQHIHRELIDQRYRKTMSSLRALF